MDASIARSLEPNILKWLYRGKVIILYGARQVGKTTLAKKIASEQGNGLILAGEQLAVQTVLQSHNLERYKQYFGNHHIIVIDEAQKITNIGTALKLIVDHLPQYQVIATGSSSFDLANTLNEPLTGRHITFTLYPLSYKEIYASNLFVGREALEQRLVYGSYPEIVTQPNDAELLLKQLSTDYLYKDVLAMDHIRKPDLLGKLLNLLALQVGQEVSISELAVALNTSRETVQKYIVLLEQAFVIFRLSSYSKNPRKEIAKGIKVYFYDLGIRNAIINNFAMIESRDDVGPLWENFFIVERMKHNGLIGSSSRGYFWRTYAQSEVDYIEELNEQLLAFETKWNVNKSAAFKAFRQEYSDAKTYTINPDNFVDFI